MKVKGNNKKVEEAIRRAGRIKRHLRLKEEIPGKEADNVVFAGSDIEEAFEALHRLAKFDRLASEERLRAKLAQATRRRQLRRVWTAVAGMAAVVSLFFGVYVLYPTGETVQELPVVVVTDNIKVPTLIQELQEQVIACKPLQEATQGTGYAAGFGMEATVEEAAVWERVVIPAGYTYRVTLPDSSEVVLNAGSELHFPSRFNDTLREVELSGEAFFKVAKSEVPFVVRAGDTRVRVYGTSFNYSYSKKSGVSEAVLVEGAIGMSAGGEEVKITPNQRVAYLEGKPMRVERVNPQHYLAWMGETFKFESMPLARIVEQIGRWYGAEITLDEQLKGQVYTIECSKAPALSRTLKVLEIITGRTVSKEGGNYYIE